MQFEKDDLKKLIVELSAYEDIQIIDIPDIDLYMDQVTTFINNKMGHLKRDEKDKALTKTMINNYTKDGILMAPKKKKYSREHMMMLILIYNLKQTLSIKDIDRLLTPLTEKLSSPEAANETLNVIYNTFLDLKQDDFNLFDTAFEKKIELIEERIKDLDENEYRLELLLIALMLVSRANAHKRLVEKIIDQYFEK